MYSGLNGLFMLERVKVVSGEVEGRGEVKGGISPRHLPYVRPVNENMFVKVSPGYF